VLAAVTIDYGEALSHACLRRRVVVAVRCVRAHDVAQARRGRARMKPSVAAPRRKPLACGGMLLVAALPLHAQQAQRTPEELRTLEGVLVTGSNVRRADLETALPVQIITREDIERSGATTPAALLNLVPANLVSTTDAVFAGNSPGRLFPSFNLRALGEGSTLVLVNGRRIANYSANAGAVNLNFIPLQAVERVEILKDGASAIYGTDAVAGVVNFILRTDYRGAQVGVYANATAHGGGEQQQASAALGYGDPVVDGFNVFVTANYRNNESLAARDRPFSQTAYRPEEGIVALQRETFPANINVAGTSLNPSAPRGCAPPLTLAVPGTSMCGHDSNNVMNILPPVKRTNAFASATWWIAHDQRVFAQYLYAHNEQVWIRNQAPSSDRRLVYPASGPFYPAAFAAAHGISGDLNLSYRSVPLGPITDDDRTDAHHVVAGVNGTLAGWSYDAAVTYSENTQRYVGVSGRISQRRLIDVMATGFVNPFGASGPEGDALLASTQVLGEVFHTRAVSRAVQFKATRDLATFPTGSLAMALGGEARREHVNNVYSAEQTSGDVIGSGSAPSSLGSGERSASAAFVELIVPAAKTVELQLAARYDHYSDFGGTTNPKIALRWQPVKATIVRASYGTGFRAPTLLDLFTPALISRTGVHDDPLRCPVTGLTADCHTDFELHTGGNPGLEPETSHQMSTGIVWEPVAGFSVSLDYWRIAKQQTIGALTEGQVFRFFEQFAGTNIVRKPGDPAQPALPGSIRYVFGGSQNLGKLETAGLDVGVALALERPAGRFAIAVDGTYVARWKQQLDAVTWTSAVGRNIVGAIPRWRHRATLYWTRGEWGATLAQAFSSGYIDANLDASKRERRVGAYESWDAQVTYAGLDATTIAVGIVNVFDRAPPFSNQNSLGLFMYDPRYADPRGRVFYAKVAVAFK
jgi:iron complex outermembrane receptor protein